MTTSRERHVKSGGAGEKRGAKGKHAGASTSGSHPSHGGKGQGAVAHAELQGIESRHPEGMSVSEIMQALSRQGILVSEATFRKWVQLGLLARSRRVGKKGKHQGSRGLYPASTVARIIDIKRRMAEGYTVEDIAKTVRLQEGVEGIERALDLLFRGLSEKIAGPGLEADGRQTAERQLAQLQAQAAELVRRIDQLSRRVIAPQEREAKARAFGSGTTGGAGDLL